MTLPDPEVRLVYSLHYAQQGRQDGEDELPPETMRGMRKKEKGGKATSKKKTQNHSGSIPNMENTLRRIANCRFKTKMDKRSGFWQVDLTQAAQELLAFVTPKGRDFRWKVMPFGVANAPALFQELM